jgi:broad specificity phosphatase PhoE
VSKSIQTTTATTRLLVLRHGQSEWNAQGRWQGQADIALTPEGVQQARKAALKLGTFDLIASSSLKRALHTAEIIAEHKKWLPKIDVPPAPNSASRVLTYDKATDEAVWEGKTVKRGDPIPQ